MSLTARINALAVAVANLIKGRQPLSTVLTDLSGRTVGVSQATSILDRASADNRYSTNKKAMVVIRMEAEAVGGNVTTGGKGYFRLPSNHSINSWTLLANIETTAKVGIFKTTYANYPTATAVHPAGGEPSLSNARKNTGSTGIGGWATPGLATDLYEVVVSENTGAQSLNLILEFTYI